NPPSCAHSDSAIWARSGVVVAPGSGNLLVATGNGAFDGRRNWGDSALMLTRNAGRLLRNWTPRNYASLESGDVDLGSTAPALIAGFAVQGGKDGKLRLLSFSRLGGRLGATGGELQTVTAPGGADVFTAPAVSGKRPSAGAAAAHLRALLAERGIRDRLQRLVQAPQLVRQAGEALGMVEAPVEHVDLVDQLVQALEHRVELTVIEGIALGHRLDS